MLPLYEKVLTPACSYRSRQVLQFQSIGVLATKLETQGEAIDGPIFPACM